MPRRAHSVLSAPGHPSPPPWVVIMTDFAAQKDESGGLEILGGCVANRDTPPSRWPHRTPLGCRDREHPPLGCRWVVRYAYVGGSRPSTVRVDAPRWPVVVPASALPAPGHQSAQMGSHRTQGGHGVGRRRPGPFGSDQAPPGPATGLRGDLRWPCRVCRSQMPLASGGWFLRAIGTVTGFLSACLRWLLWVVRASPTLVAWNQLHLALHSPAAALLCCSHDMDYILLLLTRILFRAWGRFPRRPPHRAAGQRPGPAGVAPL